MERKLITRGFIFITLGIVLGAFAAHGLETLSVEAKKIISFQTGVRYLFYQGFGMLFLALLLPKMDFIIKTQFRQIFYGSLIFTFSIFGLVLFPLINVDVKFILGPTTPIGGVLMFLGWLGILVKYIRTAG